MIITFTTQLQGINWIANKAENEDQFEVLREEMLFNFIYSGIYFLDTAQTKAAFLSKMPLWRLGHN